MAPPLCRTFHHHIVAIVAGSLKSCAAVGAVADNRDNQDRHNILFFLSPHLTPASLKHPYVMQHFEVSLW